MASVRRRHLLPGAAGSRQSPLREAHREQCLGLPDQELSLELTVSRTRRSNRSTSVRTFRCRPCWLQSRQRSSVRWDAILEAGACALGRCAHRAHASRGRGRRQRAARRRPAAPVTPSATGLRLEEPCADFSRCSSLRRARSSGDPSPRRVVSSPDEPTRDGLEPRVGSRARSSRRRRRAFRRRRRSHVRLTDRRASVIRSDAGRELRVAPAVTGAPGRLCRARRRGAGAHRGRAPRHPPRRHRLALFPILAEGRRESARLPWGAAVRPLRSRQQLDRQRCARGSSGLRGRLPTRRVSGERGDGLRPQPRSTCGGVRSTLSAASRGGEGRASRAADASGAGVRSRLISGTRPRAGRSS